MINTDAMVLRQMKITLVAAAMGVGAVIATHAMAADSTKIYDMRMGNITAKDTQERLAERFIELVEQGSKGRIDGKLYTAAALGPNREVMTGLQIGSVQAYIVPLANLSSFVPQTGVFEMPWLYPGNSVKEITNNITQAMQGNAATELKRLSEQKGFHIVSLFGLSPQLVFSSAPIKGLADFKGKKLRTVPGDEHLETVKNWGAIGVDMALPQVYTATQQGVVDGFDLPPDVTLQLKFHEVAPYVLHTLHNSLVEMIVVSNTWYASLPGDLKMAVDEAGKELERIGTQAFIESQEKAIEALKHNSKIKFTELPDGDMRSMRQLNQDGIWEKIASEPVRGPMFKTLLSDIEKLSTPSSHGR